MGSKKASGSSGNERLGRRLKALRKLMGIKQEGMADLLAVHSSHVGQLEGGHRAISHDLEVMLNLLTGVDWDWLSGTKGEDEIPLSIVDQPLTRAMITQRLAWDQSRDASGEPQKRSVHGELLNWARVFRAAANRGKLTPAIGRSIRARLDFLKNAAVGPLHASDGYLFNLQLPPRSWVAPKKPEYGSRHEELFDELSGILSPVLLLEISHALDKNPEVTRYIGKLENAIDALRAFEQLRRQYPPKPARLGNAKTQFRSIGQSPKSRPSAKSLKKPLPPFSKNPRRSSIPSLRDGEGHA